MANVEKLFLSNEDTQTSALYRQAMNKKTHTLSRKTEAFQLYCFAFVCVHYNFTFSNSVLCTNFPRIKGKNYLY